MTRTKVAVVFLVGVAVGALGGGLVEHRAKLPPAAIPAAEPVQPAQPTPPSPAPDTFHKRTVRVVVGKCLEPNGVPSLESDLADILARNVEEKTSIKPVEKGQVADTELVCTITGFEKLPLIYNQLNDVRAVETKLACEVVWRECATGKLLIPVATIRSLGHYQPELGQSITTAMQENYVNLAVQIVSMMGKPR